MSTAENTIEPLSTHEIFWTCKTCLHVNVSNMDSRGVVFCRGCDSGFLLKQVPEYVDHMFRPSRN